MFRALIVFFANAAFAAVSQAPLGSVWLESEHWTVPPVGAAPPLNGPWS